MYMRPFNVAKTSRRQTIAGKYQNFRKRNGFGQRLFRSASDAYWRPRFKPGTSPTSKALAQLSKADFTCHILAPSKRAANEEERQFATYQKKAWRQRGGIRTVLCTAMCVAAVLAVGWVTTELASLIRPVYEALMDQKSCASRSEMRIQKNPEVWANHEPTSRWELIQLLKRQEAITSSPADRETIQCMIYSMESRGLPQDYIFFPIYCLFSILCFFTSRSYASLWWPFLLVNNAAAFVYVTYGISNPVIEGSTGFILIPLCFMTAATLFQICLKVMLTKNLIRLFKRDATVEEGLISSFEKTLAYFWRSRTKQIRELLKSLYEFFARRLEHTAFHHSQTLLRFIGASPGGISASSEQHAFSLLIAHLSTIAASANPIRALVEVINCNQGGRAYALASV
jgi:hypothetical protein